MVVNFSPEPSEVNVGGAVTSLLDIGEVDIDGDVVRLAGHSALLAKGV